MLRPDATGGGLGALAVDVEQGGARAVLGEQPGRGESDAALGGPAGDDGGLRCEQHGVVPSGAR